LFGVIEPEKMSESQHHEHFEGDAIALAKLLVKDGEKPNKFLRPHGMILRFDGFCIFMEDNPKAIKIKTLWKSWNYQFRKICLLESYSDPVLRRVEFLIWTKF